MCGGVLFTFRGKELKTFFPQTNAVLTMCLKSGGIELITWDRRRLGEAGRLPQTGWARQESIDAGKWDRYFVSKIRAVLPYNSRKGVLSCLYYPAVLKNPSTT
jgi:hypothetical protein